MPPRRRALARVKRSLCEPSFAVVIFPSNSHVKPSVGRGQSASLQSSSSGRSGRSSTQLVWAGSLDMTRVGANQSSGSLAA